MSEETVTFSFGRNWKDYLSTVSDTEIDKAQHDVVKWLGSTYIAGRTVVDVGSGSGLHSLAFFRLGAKSVRSFDLDLDSVSATRSLWHASNTPKNWLVEQGSILDLSYVESLGQFDIVYSWGVLHHTGAMWTAVQNTFSLIAPGGRLWIALYKKGPRYEKDLALKKRYNAASYFTKRGLEYRRICKFMLARLRRGKNPFAWNEKVDRGMNIYHDVVDWLGGLPYETASEDEVVKCARKYNLILEDIKVSGEGGCSVYLFSLPS